MHEIVINLSMILTGVRTSNRYTTGRRKRRFLPVGGILVGAPNNRRGQMADPSNRGEEGPHY